jgi:hypothetical protein
LAARRARGASGQNGESRTRWKKKNEPFLAITVANSSAFSNAVVPGDDT